MRIKAHIINPGQGEGKAIVSVKPFSFLGDFDPVTGKVVSTDSDIFGENLSDKVFVFPTGKGSSAGPIIALLAKEAKNVPAAMVCIEAEPIIALAAITAKIPMVDKINKNLFKIIKTGDSLKVDATLGLIEVIKTK